MALCTYKIDNSVDSTQTVRARRRQGSNSLDLTIPSGVSRNYEIKPGDIFELDAVSDRGEVKLTYRRVYRKR